MEITALGYNYDFPSQHYILLPFLWKKKKVCGEVLQILTHSGSVYFLKGLKSFQVGN